MLSVLGEIDGDHSAQRRGLLFVFVAVVLYSAIHVGFRLLASSVLGEDDVVDTILVQDLRVAYDAFPRQPALYDWVLWTVQRITGPGVVGFQIIKYAALVATACFLYLTSLRVIKDRLYAILSVESLALIYSISWRYHEGFTHEVGAMVAVMATGWLFLRLIENQRRVDFALFGFAVGLGLLTEPAFGVFFVSLFAAGCLQSTVRERVLRTPLLLTVVIALIVASPYLVWLMSDPHRMASLVRPMDDYWKHASEGFLDALRGPIAYLSPLIVILPVVFPRFLAVAWGDVVSSRETGDRPNLSLLFLDAALVAFAVSVVGAVAFAISGLAVHVLMPLYVTSVVWLFSVVHRAAGEGSRTRWFARLALAIAVVALVARLLNMFVMDPFCNICRWGIPYAGFVDEMKARGFKQGTIFAVDHDLAGNLRQYFPDSKIVSRGYPRFEPKGVDVERGKIAFVWGPQLREKYVRKRFKKDLPKGMSIDDAELIRVPWRHMFYPDGYRYSEWNLLIVDKTAIKGLPVRQP